MEKIRMWKSCANLKILNANGICMSCIHQMGSEKTPEGLTPGHEIIESVRRRETGLGVAVEPAVSDQSCGQWHCRPYPVLRGISLTLLGMLSSPRQVAKGL